MTAFDDDYNDITMLNAVGYPIAMGNAQSEVKQIAKYIIKDNNENGVGYGINHFLI